MHEPIALGLLAGLDRITLELFDRICIELRYTPLRIDRCESIDSKFHKFLDDTPLPIPFGHPDGKVQSILMIPWRKSARPITHLDTFLFNRLNRSIRFMPLAIEHDASIAAPQAKYPRSMVRFGFAEP
jgi:hypothetical protein